jgi:transcriptional regulator with XRE-family HTH domain
VGVTKTDQPQKKRKGRRKQKTRIGARIRELRKRHGLTLEELAEQVGCSASYLSRLERDVSAPTQSRLVGLCKVFKCDISTLWRRPERTPSEPLKPGDRKIIFSPDRKGSVELLTDCVTGNPRFEAGILSIEPRAQATPRDSRNGELLLYVLSGQLDVELGTVRHSLSEGDAIHFQTVIPHSYFNSSNEDTKVLICSTPPSPELFERRY